MAAVTLKASGSSHEHFVSFFEPDDFPDVRVARFFAEGLIQGAAAILVATSRHGGAVVRALSSFGFDVEGLRRQGRLKMMDAEETLGELVVNGKIDSTAVESVGRIAREASARFGSVFAFGELTGLLWARGDHANALELERRWDELCRESSLSLLCVVPKPSAADRIPLCTLHAHRVADDVCRCRPRVQEVLDAVKSDALGLLNLMPTGVYLCDREGRLIFYNDRARRIWGRSPDLGEKLPADSTSQDHEVRMASLVDERGAARGTLVLFHDVSERTLAERQMAQRVLDLSRSNRELAQFAQVASRDIKEPLRMIRLFGQVLSTKLEGTGDLETRQALELVTNGSRRIAELIDALLDYSSIGETVLREKFDSGSAFECAKENIASLIAATGAVITSDPLPIVHGNFALFTLLMQNLLSNGIKFCSGRVPRLHVGVREAAHEWIFSVKDNGIGIEAEFFDRVFVIYQRLHTQAEYSGTGIGLATCKRVVEWHGGRIWVESKQGEGSTFSFTMPKSQLAGELD